MLPLCLWVMRDSPESIGLAPDGEPVEAGATAVVSTRTPIGTAMRTLAFWQLAGSFFTCGFSMSLLSSHGVPMLTDHGYSPMFASWVIGVLGASSIGLHPGPGRAGRPLGARPVLAAIYAGRALIFAGLFLVRDNPAAMLGVAIVGGITLAGSMSMTSMLTADIYGRYSVGSILGVIFLVHQTGAALGSSLAGTLFESTGGYGAAFAVACVLLAARRARQPAHRQRRARLPLGRPRRRRLTTATPADPRWPTWPARGRRARRALPATGGRSP